MPNAHGKLAPNDIASRNGCHRRDGHAVKAVMYHYVRPRRDDLPHQHFLHIDDFRKQLDHFDTHYGIVSRDELFGVLDGGDMPQSKVLLTFDDGLADHFSFVLPELKKRRLLGLFYVPTGMYRSGKLLNVHRIHHLIGVHGGTAVMNAMLRLTRDDMLSHGRVEEFRSRTYKRQTNDTATTFVKRTLNYFIANEWRDRLLDSLMEQFVDDEVAVAAEYYITPEQIAEMQYQKMIIGSHSVSHPVLRTLGVPQQRKEIVDSFDFLDELTGGLPFRTFAYPYGGFHTFTDDTELLLERASCRFAFNVVAVSLFCRLYVRLRNSPTGA